MDVYDFLRVLFQFIVLFYVGLSWVVLRVGAKDMGYSLYPFG